MALSSYEEPIDNAKTKPVRCAFIDDFQLQCSLLSTHGGTQGGKSWCSEHNKKRMKVYFGYKKLHDVLDAFPVLSISLLELEKCDSHEKAKEWAIALRTKHTLLDRCIRQRAYFTKWFYGNDEDFGHEKLRINLEQQFAEVDYLLGLVERRACVLLLASQNATWVMDDDRSEADSSEVCDNFDDDPQPPVTVLSSPEYPAVIVDPVEAAILEKRSQICERIWTRLARYCAPVKSRFYTERLAVIWARVCRAVLTDPTLTILAQKYDGVTVMLNDRTLDPALVEKLWTAIKELYVHDVRAAIDDVLYPVRETGEYIVVLGTRVHRDLSPNSLPLHGWGHMAAIIPCYSCLRKTCKNMNAIVELTRYTILCDSRLSQASTLFQYLYTGIEHLALCGFIPTTTKRLTHGRR